MKTNELHPHFVVVIYNVTFSFTSPYVGNQKRNIHSNFNTTWMFYTPYSKSRRDFVHFGTLGVLSSWVNQIASTTTTTWCSSYVMQLWPIMIPTETNRTSNTCVPEACLLVWVRRLQGWNCIPKNVRVCGPLSSRELL
jgi:hypothetical protein